MCGLLIVAELQEDLLSHESVLLSLHDLIAELDWYVVQEVLLSLQLSGPLRLQPALFCFRG